MTHWCGVTGDITSPLSFLYYFVVSQSMNVRTDRSEYV